jgi:hypothetical protein
MTKDKVNVYESEFYTIETDDSGTWIRANEDLFDVNDFEVDSVYFITKEDNNKLAVALEKRLGYDWQERYGIDYVDDISIDHEDIVDVLHEVINDVLDNKINRFFLDELKRIKEEQ